jgi:hypothetical protein
MLFTHQLRARLVAEHLLEHVFKFWASDSRNFALTTSSAETLASSEAT